MPDTSGPNKYWPKAETVVAPQEIGLKTRLGALLRRLGGRSIKGAEPSTELFEPETMLDHQTN